MTRTTLIGSATLVLLVAGTATAQIIIRIGPRSAALGPAPAPAKPSPKLEAVAETKLLMEGLAQPNYRAVEKALKDKPADAESWAFTRGQSLLMAETANLLMLRP